MNPVSAPKTEPHSPVSIDATRHAVDKLLSELFEVRRQDAAVIGHQYERLWQTAEKAAMAGGKRIRPYLTMAVEGSGDPRVWPIAVAQELIHVAILMHDDIIDQDFKRHGQENVSGAYRSLYSTYLDGDKAIHYANSAALLAGDALISEAYRMIHGSDFDHTIQNRLSGQLSKSIFEVIGGELLDVEAGFVHDEPFNPIQVYRYKTASYSFMGPIVSGAIAAGLEPDQIEALTDFAQNAGIAYQIQDDLLGVFGDENTTGKSTLTDLREGKRTLLIEDYETSMSVEQRRRFDAVFGSKSSQNSELALLKRDIEESGAKTRVAALSDEYFDRSLQSLGRVADGNRREQLELFTNSLRKRSF